MSQWTKLLTFVELNNYRFYAGSIKFVWVNDRNAKSITQTIDQFLEKEIVRQKKNVGLRSA